MDPATITMITGISVLCVGLFTKLILILRANVKTCCFITFRSPSATPRTRPSPNYSPRRTIELNQITPELINELNNDGKIVI